MKILHMDDNRWRCPLTDLTPGDAFYNDDDGHVYEVCDDRGSTTVTTVRLGDGKLVDFDLGRNVPLVDITATWQFQLRGDGK